MARFISRLIGSDTLTAHDVVAIANGSAKRDGLIASRSAVSTDIYADLETAYQNGGAGTYFPPDTFVVTNGILTGSVYTSSLTNPGAAGIRTPANYSTRPTASIRSTDTTLVGPSATSDSASVTYDVYLAATTAVKTVLDSITGGGPYGRLGQNPSRTLHSIWHDPTLSYFAWDDFTPGTPTPVVSASTTNTLYLETSDTLPLNVALTYEYLADTLGPRTITAARIKRQSTQAVVATLGTQNLGNGESYNWNVSGNTVGVDAEGPVTYDVEATGSFADVTIPAHVGPTGQAKTDSVFTVQRLYAFNDILYGSDLNALCADNTSQTVYANGSTFTNSNLLYVDKAGNGVFAGFYARSGDKGTNNFTALTSDGGASVNPQIVSCPP